MALEFNRFKMMHRLEAVSEASDLITYANRVSPAQAPKTIFDRYQTPNVFAVEDPWTKFTGMDETNTLKQTSSGDKQAEQGERKGGKDQAQEVKKEKIEDKSEDDQEAEA